MLSHQRVCGLYREPELEAELKEAEAARRERRIFLAVLARGGGRKACAQRHRRHDATGERNYCRSAQHLSLDPSCATRKGGLAAEKSRRTRASRHLPGRVSCAGAHMASSSENPAPVQN